MNGDATDNASPSSYLRSTSTLSTFSSSPRVRRYEDMKKTTSAYSSSALTSLPSSTALGSSAYGGKYGSAAPGGGTSGGSYRLASLDRLAYRHKLYESNGGASSELTPVAPPTVPASSTSSSSFLHSNNVSLSNFSGATTNGTSTHSNLSNGINAGHNGLNGGHNGLNGGINGSHVGNGGINGDVPSNSSSKTSSVPSSATANGGVMTSTPKPGLHVTTATIGSLQQPVSSPWVVS